MWKKRKHGSSKQIGQRFKTNTGFDLGIGKDGDRTTRPRVITIKGWTKHTLKGGIPIYAPLEYMDKEKFGQLRKEGILIGQWSDDLEKTVWVIDIKKAIAMGHQVQTKDGINFGASVKQPDKLVIFEGKGDKQKLKRFDSLNELETFIAHGGHLDW